MNRETAGEDLDGQGKIEKILRPMLHTSKSFFIFGGILSVILLWGGFTWFTQLNQGLGLTGMNDKVIWGLYLSNFIFFIGIAFAGIAIAAAIKVAGLEKYEPLARVAEVLTVVSIIASFLSLVFDLGRPDRVFHMVRYYFERIGASPLMWDFTAMFLYLLLSVAFLYFALRRDLNISNKIISGLSGPIHRVQKFFHDVFLFRYTEEEDESVKGLEWWIAATILPIVVMLHSIIGWVFGLIVSRPGWFNPLYAPAFVLAALTSGVAIVLIIAAILRKLYGWEDLLKTEIFEGISPVLGIFVLIYLYFMLSTELGAVYAGGGGEVIVAMAKLKYEWAIPYWSTVIVGFLIPSLVLIFQSLRPESFSIRKTVVASGLIAGALWVKRVIIVVPSLARPNLPFTWGFYSPTWVEWSLVAFCFALVALLYTIFVKLFPLFPVKDMIGGED